MNDSRKLIIFDTTLRDGEQSPGASMNKAEKLRIATQLEDAGVDVIEAGFPVASNGDFEAVKEIADNLKLSQVAALCRADQVDINRAWEAIKGAVNPRIHIFIATSELHMACKLQLNSIDVLNQAVQAVKYASTLTTNIEFSAEDASRSDKNFLCTIFEAVIEAGATTINIPDTVGYAVSSEFAKLVEYVMANVKNINQTVLSVHCHNDLGLATANTLAAVNMGARQVEVTINGIGERAGNTSLEEVVMAISTRPNLFNVSSQLDTTKICSLSRLVSMITGILVQPNKAIVGANAFTHQAGIHQAGVLKNPMTYEIMKPETVGVHSNILVLGKHSGRSALRVHIEKMGYSLTKEELNEVFIQFKKLADKKKLLQDEDIEALVNEIILREEGPFEFDYVNVYTGNTGFSIASVGIKIYGRSLRATDSAKGPIDAIFSVIRLLTGTKSKQLRFTISALTEGIDAQGEVTVRLQEAGVVALGKGSDFNIITASAKAYIDGLNRLEFLKENPKPRGINVQKIGLKDSKSA